METPKPEPQPADTQEQPEKASEIVLEQVGETAQEQTDETPQVVRRISSSSDGHHWRSTRKHSFPFRSSKTASPYSLAAARATPLTASSVCSASAG